VAVAFNNKNTDVQASNASSFSSSMSATAGSNLCARVDIAIGKDTGAPAISGNVTYNSVAMTAAGTAIVDSTAKALAAIYVLTAPSTGANTLAFSIANGPATTIYADLITYTGVDQTTPVRAGSYNSSDTPASGSTVTLTITSQTNDMTCTCASVGGGNQNLGSGTNKTVRNNDTAGATCIGTDDAAGAASNTHTWTMSGSDTGRIICGFSIAAAGGAAAQVPYPFIQGPQAGAMLAR
jgi:hypothetical protein